MLGLTIGLINGILVTVLEVPAFIATLTMLFIGRGVILGLTGGKNIAFEIKAGETNGFFGLGEINAFGFNNQILLFLLIAAVGAVTLARTIDRLDDLRHRRKRAGARATPASTRAWFACVPTSCPRSARSPPG